MDVQALRQLKPELDQFLQRYAPLFGREETQEHARRFVQGLLLGGDRRSVENIAEAIDGCVVRSLQKFIAQSPWSDDRLLEQLQDHVAAELGEADATLNVDETGFPKKGTKSVGVKRQYSGTLGRTDNRRPGVGWSWPRAVKVRGSLSTRACGCGSAKTGCRRGVSGWWCVGVWAKSRR